MIDTETDFPFEFCKGCQHMDVNVNKETLYSFDEIVENRIRISCRNEKLCRYLIGKIERREFRK